MLRGVSGASESHIDERTSNMHDMLGRSSHVYGETSGDICQDLIVRKTARKLVARSWEILKLCTRVVEENEKMLSTMLC